MSDVNHTLDTFAALSPLRLYRIVQGRLEVFVVEQDCVYQDLDDVDLVCEHLAVWMGEPDGVLLAYCRFVPPGVKYTEPSIGRVITPAAGRGAGHGRALVAEAVRLCDERWPGAGIRISAQAYLIRFYRGFGFEEVGEIYLEDNIDHIEMVRR